MPDQDASVQPDDSKEQLPADTQRNVQDTTTPPDFVEFEGVKVPKESFEKAARERYKDHFDAYENREKWQAENTRKAQELAQLERDAESFRRLRSEQSQPNQPQNPYEKARQEYITEMKRDFPDIDDRFLSKQFDSMMRVSEMRARESVTPMLEQQMNEWEERFLREHPLVQTGTPQYQKLAQKLKHGYDPEDAYELVYKNEIREKEFSDRKKAADEEAKRKLIQSRQSGGEGKKSTEGMNRGEKLWAWMEEAGVSRND